jgi:hypothetical protein
MKISGIVLLSASLLLAACGADETTAPAQGTTFETRLSAIAVAPTSTLSDPTVSMMVSVTSTLPESVSGGACAQAIEARTPSGTTWTDVKSSFSACSAQAILLAPGATASFTAVADPAKIRSVAGAAGTSVVLRARHTLAGASASYTLQSTEVTWQLQ